MKNRMMMLLAFLAVFAISAPALAAPPAEDAATETGDVDDEDAPKADLPAADEDTPKADLPADDAEGGDTGTGGDELAPAKEIESDKEAVEAAKGLYGALQQKQWALALGLALSLLVFGLRRTGVLNKVPAKALPWVTAGLGVLSYVIAALMAEGASIPDALLGGATAGVTAVGLWEMLLKHFLSAKKEEAADSDS